METALFKNVNNLKIKGGSFNINQGPATFNDNRTIYNNDHSRHVTNNAPVQQYDNRQYSTNHRQIEAQRDWNADFESVYGQERPSYQPSLHSDGPHFAPSEMRYGSPPMPNNPFHPHPYHSPPLTPPVSRHMGGGYSVTNEDGPYADQGFVSGQLGNNSSHVRRAKSNLSPAAGTDQFINKFGSHSYAVGAEIQRMTPRTLQSFREVMRSVEQDCTAPDSDDSDAVENESLANNMANLDINGAKFKKTRTSSTAPRMEPPLESNPETPSHQKGQKTSKNPFAAFAKVPWPSPEYTPPSFVDTGDGSFPGLQPSSIFHVDNRAYTTNINSNNTSNSNIQDSYNDDSTTITKISKGESRRRR